MVLLTVEGEHLCPICNEDVVINTKPDEFPYRGICDECGLLYGVHPRNPAADTTLDDVEVLIDRDDKDWKIIKSYYEATGNRALVYGCCEYTEVEAENFDSWANSKFDTQFGVTKKG